MQKNQPRTLCAVLWLAVVVLILSAATRVTYGYNRVFDGCIMLDGESYPATVGMDIRYSRDPFFGEHTWGVIDVQSELEDNRVQRYDRYINFHPGWYEHSLWNPSFAHIGLTGFSRSPLGFVDLHGMMDIDHGEMLLLYDNDFSFAGRDCSEERASEIFTYLDSWLNLEDYYNENPFSHTPLIDRETAIATRTETPPSVLLKQAVSEFFADCWEYLLIGVVALVALILSHWFPQIYLNHWILDALREGRSGAKRYLRHSRICFTAMGLTVPLFACAAHLFPFSTPWYWLTGGMCLFGGMIVVLIALIALLHRRVWIPITTQP